MKPSASALDGSAVALSFMCLVHCLALPVASAFLPLAGVLAEAEWIHRLLVLTAVPVTTLAIASHGERRFRVSFVAPALIGLLLLLAAAFIEALHDVETLLTITGAVLLAAAHAWRWARAASQGRHY